MKTTLAALLLPLFLAAACQKKTAPTPPPPSPLGPTGATGPNAQGAPTAPAPMPRRLAVGDLAPELARTAQDGKSISLRDLRGKKVLLWFYPKAKTPGCTAEGQSLRDRAAELQKRGVQILGASFDPPGLNAEFAQMHGFPFPLLSDTDRALALAFGAADSPSAGYARRVSALLDEGGRVLKLYPNVNPQNHADEVLRDLDALAAKK